MKKDTFRTLLVVLFALFLMLLTTSACNITSAQTKVETAYAGDVVYHKWGSEWWAIYTTYSSYNQPILVDGKSVDGAFVTYNDGFLDIQLGDLLELNDGISVFIQGYSYEDIRNRRLSTVQFRTYQGTDLEMEVGHYEYFVIKLMVKLVA